MPMSSAAAAALTSGGISIANGAINYALQRQQQVWNEEMMNKQNEWSLNMWNKTNEYNSPVQQKQRMLDAGLNPLYYGLDGSSANGLESSQALGYNPASINIANPYQASLQARLTEAQIENTQADTAKKSNENLTETQRREKIIAEIENTRQQLNNLKSEQDLTDKQVAQIDKALEWADRLNAATVNEKQSTAALNRSQQKRVEELLENEKLIQVKTLEDFDKKWQKIDAEISKMAQETGLLKEDIANYALNHASNGFFGTGISLQNLIRAFAGEVKNGKPSGNVSELSNNDFSDESFTD